MTKRVVVTPAAASDIQNILAYSIRNWGIDRAIAYRDGINSSIDLLALFPDKGVTLPNLGAGVRRSRYESHYIVYRQASDEFLRVLRVVHVRRRLTPGMIELSE